VPFGLLLIVFLLGIGACSTKKNTWTRRTFHNITAHYNAYYNGQVTLTEAQQDIAKNHKDNYSEILDIFPLGTMESVKTHSMKFDRIMEKASLVIHKHSMVFNDIERNPWIARSYFMIGQARFYAHEYGLAKQVFRYVISKYPKSDVRYDAQLWIAHIQVIQGDYDEARGNLGALENYIKSGETTDKTKQRYPLIYADLYLKQENYTAAIPYLRQALKAKMKKNDRARIYFILGQVLQEQNQFSDAIDAYRMVLKSNPVYDLDFNARINMAQCFDGSGEDSKTIISQLNKMLKDEKNKDYLDQVYYALAGVALKTGDEAQAIEYLKLSVEKSTNNNLQKSFSSLKLADIYFANESYENAQAYYDSTILFLPKTYPDYDQLKERKDILTELVSNILIVQYQDSLLDLADMSASQRNKVIDGIIQQVIEEDRRKQEEEMLRQQSLQFMEENRRTTQSVTQGKSQKAYWYNPQTLSFGFTEFQKKWGQRKLEDYWRLSSKVVMEFGSEEEMEEEAAAAKDSLQKLKNDKKSRAYYLADVPLTQEMKDTANRKISDALYNMGFIYKEQLQNRPKATESFEKLLKRYPKTKHTPAAYYFLHQLFTIVDDDGEANFYKKALIKEYPESDYAKLIEDPEYYKKLQQDSEKANDLYEKAFRMYKLNKYDKAIKYASEAISTYPDEKVVLAQCALIKALSIGKTSDTTSFLVALNTVVNSYDGSESAQLAQVLIDRIKAGQKVGKGGTENPATAGRGDASNSEKPSIYDSNRKNTHMFIVIVNRKNMRSVEMQQSITQHNDKYFATDRLTVSAIPLDQNNIIVGVSNFKDADAAVVYLKTLQRNKEARTMLRKVNNEYFIISQENYTRLYKSRNLEAYKQFYKKQYPGLK
jgi:tetratricopeptide (TPR) repeat protein